MALGLLSFLLPGEGLRGQGWTGDLHVGQASYETTPLSSRSANAILGLRHGMDRRFLQVSAGVPLSGEDLLWGVTTLGDRYGVRRGRTAIGVDISGLVHAQRDRDADLAGWGARAEILPVLSTSMGPLVAELRSGASVYRGTVGGERWSRDLHVSDVRVLLPVGPTAVLGGDVQHLRTREEAYTFVGGTGSAAVGRGAVWGAAGAWVSGLPEEAPSTGWSAGASLSVTRSMDLWGTVRREAFDPLFLGTPRTSWGLGVSRRLGRARVPPPPAGAEHRSGGITVLRVPLSETSSPPAVAGDFSGWEPVPMHREGTHWRVELNLEPGIYHFAFREAGGEWFVPEGVPNRRDDGMGGWVAVLIVPAEAPGRRGGR